METVIEVAETGPEWLVRIARKAIRAGKENLTIAVTITGSMVESV